MTIAFRKGELNSGKLPKKREKVKILAHFPGPGPLPFIDEWYGKFASLTPPLTSTEIYLFWVIAERL
jgi:hypothetical protein